jgi:hypothetical protein
MIIQYGVHMVKRDSDGLISFANSFNNLFDSIPEAKAAIHANIAMHVPHVKHREIIDYIAPHPILEIRANLKHSKHDEKAILHLEYTIKPMHLGPQLDNLLTLMGHGEDGVS